MDPLFYFVTFLVAVLLGCVAYYVNKIIVSERKIAVLESIVAVKDKKPRLRVEDLGHRHGGEIIFRGDVTDIENAEAERRQREKESTDPFIMHLLEREREQNYFCEGGQFPDWVRLELCFAYKAGRAVTPKRKQALEDAFRDGWENGWSSCRHRARKEPADAITYSAEDFNPDWATSRTNCDMKEDE